MGKVSKKAERSGLVERAIISSEKEAISRNQSLALIHPTEVSFTWKKFSKSEIVSAKEAFFKQASQLSLLEKELAAYQPCPYQFKMRYRDESGPHNKICADWETSAAFFNLQRSYDEDSVLKHLEKTYCEDYVKTGLVFALGNMKKRPQTWQLLGIFPTEIPKQSDLFVG